MDKASVLSRSVGTGEVGKDEPSRWVSSGELIATARTYRLQQPAITYEIRV
jgi:hypothetical protein